MEKETKITTNPVVTEPTTSHIIPPVLAPIIIPKPPLQPISELRNRIQEEEKLPEIQVPIKKYYGRKRDDQSSSDEEINLDELMEDNEKTK